MSDGSLKFAADRSLLESGICSRISTLGFCSIRIMLSFKFKFDWPWPRWKTLDRLGYSRASELEFSCARSNRIGWAIETVFGVTRSFFWRSGVFPWNLNGEQRRTAHDRCGLHICLRRAENKTSGGVNQIDFSVISHNSWDKQTARRTDIGRMSYASLNMCFDHNTNGLKWGW